MKQPSKNVVQIATAIGLLVLLVIMYFGGYFWLAEPGKVVVNSKQGTIVHHFRYYRYEIVADAYKPLAWIESTVTGRDVETAAWPFP